MAGDTSIGGQAASGQAVSGQAASGQASGSQAVVAQADPMPTFTIKASDPFACAVIRCWITMAASYRKISGVKPVPAAKVADAEQVLVRFQRWQLEHGTKVPD